MELPLIAGRPALALCLLLIGCAAKTTGANTPGVPTGRFEEQLADSCGERVAYPISGKCISMMGSVGPLLQHRSDLIMAIWRSCPDENPCNRVAANEPACSGQADSAADSCKKVQQADYSCAALLKDPAYSGYLHQIITPDPYECRRAKTALTEFDQEVERMSLRIQWYRVFAAQGY